MTNFLEIRFPSFLINIIMAFKQLQLCHLGLAWHGNNQSSGCSQHKSEHSECHMCRQCKNEFVWHCGILLHSNKCYYWATQKILQLALCKILSNQLANLEEIFIVNIAFITSCRCQEPGKSTNGTVLMHAEICFFVAAIILRLYMWVCAIFFLLLLPKNTTKLVESE